MTSTLLSQLTTAAVGGPAHKFIKAGTEAEIIDAVRAADAAHFVQNHRNTGLSGLPGSL